MSARLWNPRQVRALRLILAAAVLLLILAAPALPTAPGSDEATAQTPVPVPFTRGVGWTAQFYNDIAFGNGAPPVAQANYLSGLDIVWPDFPTDGSGLLVPGVAADNFSVRFTSTQSIPVTGTYTFTITIDDQAKVFIQGVEVFNQTQLGTYTFDYPLAAGSQVIQVELIELTQTAIIQFGWQLGGVGPGPTPGPTGPTGNVVQVRGLSLRTGPYLGASFIGVLRPDTAYPVLARNTDEGGVYTWYKVQVGDQIGWSSGRYLTINGDIDSIPFESTVFEQIDNPPDRGVIASPRAVMNLRRRPSIRSPRIGQVPWGEEVPLLGRTIQGGQNFWFQVRYNGVVGWIFAPFVSVRGAIDAVPVY